MGRLLNHFLVFLRHTMKVPLRDRNFPDPLFNPKEPAQWCLNKEGLLTENL